MKIQVYLLPLKEGGQSAALKAHLIWVLFIYTKAIPLVTLKVLLAWCPISGIGQSGVPRGDCGHQGSIFAILPQPIFLPSRNFPLRDFFSPYQYWYRGCLVIQILIVGRSEQRGNFLRTQLSISAAPSHRCQFGTHGNSCELFTELCFPWFPEVCDVCPVSWASREAGHLWSSSLRGCFQ